jgi:hypothetical protein
MSLSLFKNRPDNQFQDLLMAHADGLVAGNLDREQLRSRHSRLSLSDIDDLFTLAERISLALIEISPSPDFVDELRLRLLEVADQHNRSLWGKLRHMPRRTQLAAGIGGATLTAGVVLVAHRPMRDAALELWRNRRIIIA